MNEHFGLSGALPVRSNIAPARLDIGYAFNAGALSMKSNIGYAFYAGGSTVKSDNVSVRPGVVFPFNAGGQRDTNSLTECRAAFTSLQGDDRDRFW